MKLLTLSLLVIGLYGCGNDSDDYQQKEIFVDHYKSER